MKKSYLLCLIIFLMCACPVAAQEKTSSFETYAKWRREVLGRLPSGPATPHYSVATVTRRVDADSARIEFTVVGKMSGYTLEMQPVKLGAQQEREVAGELTTSRMRGRAEDDSLNPISDGEAIIPVNSQANAIEVKWTPEGVAEGMSYTLVLPLENTSSANVFGMILTSPKPTASTFRKIGLTSLDGPCFYAVGQSVRCGSLVACCYGRCARFDFVNCAVTCCTNCQKPDTCDGILPP
jgi:hypothetical protein